MHAILNMCWSCTSLRKVWSAIWCVSTSDLEYFSTDCPPYMDRQCWLAKHYGSVEWPKPEPPPLTSLERLITWSGDVCSIIPSIPCSQNMHHTRKKHAKDTWNKANKSRSNQCDISSAFDLDCNMDLDIITGAYSKLMLECLSPTASHPHHPTRECVVKQYLHIWDIHHSILWRVCVWHCLQPL